MFEHVVPLILYKSLCSTDSLRDSLTAHKLGREVCWDRPGSHEKWAKNKQEYESSSTTTSNSRSIGSNCSSGRCNLVDCNTGAPRGKLLLLCLVPAIHPVSVP